MKKVTMYQAKDGELFNYEDECLERDDLIIKVKKLLDELVSRKFLITNEGQKVYIQQNPVIVKHIKRELIYEALKYCNNDQVLLSYLDGLHNNDRNVDFIISECGSAPKVLKRAWYRMTMIDHDGKEYEQLYWLLNKFLVKQVALNEVNHD